MFIERRQSSESNDQVQTDKDKKLRTGADEISEQGMDPHKAEQMTI
jgi:hypothetical protein